VIDRLDFNDKEEEKKNVWISGGTYANVTVSVIFGFLNFFIWFGSLWFVYKETKFFKSRTAQQQNQQQQQPPTGQNNFSNLAAPPPTQFRAPGSIS
jgi:cytoskeletal protein RodZ